MDDASGGCVTLAADAITLNGDYIGLDLAGAADGNHGDGVRGLAMTCRFIPCFLCLPE